jgi:hypothetical protein
MPYNAVSWLKSSPFQLRFQAGKQTKIARIHVGRVGSLSNHRNVFGQESLNQLRGMCWCVVMMQQPCIAGTLRMAKSSVKNGMYRTSAYPHLLRKFWDGDTTVLHDQSRHLVNEPVISACWGPSGTSVALHRHAVSFNLLAPEFYI